MADKADPVATRLPKDLNKEFEKYCDDHGISKGDAVRRFIERGLMQAGYTPLRSSAGISAFAMTVGKYAIYGAVVGVLVLLGIDAIGPIALVFFAIGAAVGTVVALYQRSRILKRLTDRLPIEPG